MTSGSTRMHAELRMISRYSGNMHASESAYMHANTHLVGFLFHMGNTGFLMRRKQMLILTESTTPLKVCLCVRVHIWATIHLPPSVLVRWNVWEMISNYAFILFMLLSFARTLERKACFFCQFFFYPAATLHPVGLTLSHSVHLLVFTEGCSRIRWDLSKQIAAAHLVVIWTKLPFSYSHTTVPEC